MNEREARQERIKERIAESQERLKRETPGVPVRQHFPDAYPPESYRSLAAEYPWLTVAAGLGAGLLVGALLPKKAGTKLGKRALAAATVAGELGLALSKQARERAGDAGREGLARLGEGGAAVRRKAGSAAGSARATGLTLARHAVKLAARARR